MAARNPDKLAPPYVSYKTFQGYIQVLQKGGIPQRIDTSTMRQLSGQNQMTVKAAFRYLGLMHVDGTPTEALREIVAADGTEQQHALQKNLERAYSFLFADEAFDLATASDAQFRDKFRETGLTGDTLRKAETFFLAAAKEAGIPVSQYIVAARRQGPPSGVPRPRNSSRRRPPGGNGEETNGQGSPPAEKVVPSESRERLSPREMLLQGLILRLPPDGKSWTEGEQNQWFESCQAIIRMLIPIRADRSTEAPDDDN